jgi:amidase
MASTERAVARRDLWRASAAELVALLRSGELTPSDAVYAAMARIEGTDGIVNALPTRCYERALAAAVRVERASREHRDDPSWLAGLPIAVKDVTDVAGVRCTYGSPIYASRIPTESDILVQRLEARGAIVIAKANTPEFASAGGLNTSNAVFGATRNPWNVQWACGGSSGGSAAAVAAGEVWAATGTDLGGSLRQPASSCGVVPRGPELLPHDPLCVAGPVARRVEDIALLLDAWAGAHPGDPISRPAPSRPYRAQSSVGPARGTRLAYSETLGLVPVAREIAAICRAAAERCSGMGWTVAQASPDFGDARAILDVLRPAWLASHWSDLLASDRERLQTGFRARLEAGMALTAHQVWQAERQRAALVRRVVQFFERHDALACPVVPVAPFAADTQSVASIEGQALERESDWMLLTYAVSLTGCPALSLPCGYTTDGRPVGLQLVAPPGEDGRLLAIGRALEEALEVHPRAPVDPAAASTQKQ